MNPYEMRVQVPSQLAEAWYEMLMKVEANANKPNETPSSKERDALIDIAYDCGDLASAQRRAREALK